MSARACHTVSTGVWRQPDTRHKVSFQREFSKVNSTFVIIENRLNQNKKERKKIGDWQQVKGLNGNSPLHALGGIMGNWANKEKRRNLVPGAFPTFRVITM